MTSRLLLGLVLAGLLGCAPRLPFWAQGVPEWIDREADEADGAGTLALVAWRSRHKRERLEEAIEAWERVVRADPRATEALLSLSRGFHFLAQNHLSSSPGERTRSLERGMLYAEWAMVVHSTDFRAMMDGGTSLREAMVELGPSGGPILYWYACNLYAWVMESPLAREPPYGVQLKAVVEQAVRTAPATDGGGPHRLMGLVLSQLSRPAQDLPRAGQHLRWALARFPRRLDNALALAEHYLFPSSRTEEARALLGRLVKAPLDFDPDRDGPENLLARMRAARLLAAWEAGQSPRPLVDPGPVPGLDAPRGKDRQDLP